MRIVVFGAGVQGTVYGLRLARAGHEVALVASPRRAEELRRIGAAIRNAETSETISARLSVREELAADCAAEVCIVAVRREQLNAALESLSRATEIGCFVFLVNHGNGSADIFAALGKSRTVLAFPGIAGASAEGSIRYIEIPQQHTVVEKGAARIADLFQGAGFTVDRVGDMDGWLMRHAVFIVSIAGALYEKGCSAKALAEDREAMGRFIRAVREGWLELDRRGVSAAPPALRFIFRQAPLWISVRYWSSLLGSTRGELYFAAHARHAPAEMAALALDVKSLRGRGTWVELPRLFDAIERFQTGRDGPKHQQSDR